MKTTGKIQTVLAAAIFAAGTVLSAQTTQQPTSTPPDPNTPVFGHTPDQSPAQSPTQTAPAPPPAQTAPEQAPMPKPDAKPKGGDSKQQDDSTAKATSTAPVKNGKPETDSIPSPGDALDPHIKAGSEDDVSAVGTRNIGGRGLSNWYSTNWEISTGKQYSMQLDKSAKFITDPVINEYVNRIAQNLVKNSDAKVPFTVRVLDSDEVNAMALPGGFFYVNSGLILAADEEAELAGVMAHEIAHVAAHHTAREMTRLNYAQIGTIPLMIYAGGSWLGYGLYEASGLAIPLAFMQFSRSFEAEADYLGVQYMYRAGYDPQAFITIFEKLEALEKQKPGFLSKAFASHPQTPDRIVHSEDEIATILPARPDYVVTTSEFDDVKARLARIENKRKLNDKGGANQPTLRRTAESNGNGNSQDQGDDRPTLHRPSSN